MKLIAIGTGAALICFGCTITPTTPQSTVASFDGTNQNSGFIGFTNHYGIITEAARLRYNALITMHGSRFLVPPYQDAGVSRWGDGTWLMTPEAVTRFETLNRWHRQAQQ